MNPSIADWAWVLHAENGQFRRKRLHYPLSALVRRWSGDTRDTPCFARRVRRRLGVMCQVLDYLFGTTRSVAFVGRRAR